MAEHNIIRPSSSLPKYTHSDFPALYWKPDGTNFTANSAADVAEGDTPYHPNSAPVAAPKVATPKVEAAAPVKPTLTKAETVAALNSGGVEHDAAKPHKTLYELLLTSVKAALSEAKVDFDDTSTDAKDLLAKLP